MDAVERVGEWLDRAPMSKPPFDQIREVLSLARSNGWQDIASAPWKQTVLLGELGTKLTVAAYRIGPVAGWRHAHSSDEICFTPTHWQPLPEPPLDRLRGSEDESNV
jgi:hypothetical protein